MSNLENLVPPLELCKKIPAGEFEDSAFAWWQITPFEEWQVVVRSTLTTIPAPTLQEILVELGKFLVAPCVINNTEEILLESLPIPGLNPEKQKFIPGHFWAVQGGKPLEYALLPMIERDADNPATAALQLFLKQSELSDQSNK